MCDLNSKGTAFLVLFIQLIIHSVKLPIAIYKILQAQMNGYYFFFGQIIKSCVKLLCVTSTVMQTLKFEIA